MKVKTYFIGLLFLMAILADCSYGKSKNFDYGKVENGKYVNSYFGMEMSIPENWIVMSQENFDEAAKLGEKLITGDDKRLQAAVKVSEVRTANLLLVSEKEYGSANNISISIVSENIKLFSGLIKNGNDYLAQAAKLLEQSQLQYKVDYNFTTEIINNQEFSVMNGIMFDSIYQKIYVILKNDFAITFTITYFDDEQKEFLENVMNTVKFK